MKAAFAAALIGVLALSLSGASASWAWGNDVNYETCETVAEVIQSKFPTLFKALDSLEMVDALNQTYLMVTVLAPTDQAFSAAATRLNTTVDNILTNTPLLNSSLPHHLVNGLVQLDTYELNTFDPNVRIKFQPSAILNGVWAEAKVTTPPLRACYSMVYAIDDVLAIA